MLPIECHQVARIRHQESIHAAQAPRPESSESAMRGQGKRSVTPITSHYLRLGTLSLGLQLLVSRIAYRRV